MNLNKCVFEYKEFTKFFYFYTVNMKVLKDLNGNIEVLDILNHYRIKLLSDNDLEIIKDIKLFNFDVFKGLNTDLVFISFEIKNLDLLRLKHIFNPTNRAYQKYKHEFTKTERRLLFKLKNSNVYEYNHKDCISNALQLDLNGEMVYSPLEETYENSKQSFESEYDFKKRRESEKWSEIKRMQSVKAEAIKALRLWKQIKMPRLPKAKKKSRQKITPDDLKKERGWRRGQQRESLGLLYIDEYGQLDKDLTVAPIKIKQKIIERKTVFISTEKREEKEKRTLW